jgi:SAM (Sterile alpha motif) domain-containing protein
MVMQQIAQWLETLGMTEYAPRFIENRVDFSVLADLTDQDLKDLGVVLGDRRTLLRAILPPWRIRKAPCSGRDMECCCAAGCWP